MSDFVKQFQQVQNYVRMLYATLHKTMWKFSSVYQH